MTTLIIDDDPFTLKLLTRQLTTLGVEDIHCFEGAEAALSFLPGIMAATTLVLCDLQMPGIDGVEMLRHLGTIGYPGSLVLISGEDERILQTAGLLASGQALNLLGTLHKPIATERLREMLLRHHAQRPIIQARASRKAYTAAELRQALAEGQITCHFQPKVCLASGRLVAVESLVRWQHPQDGLVYPDQFIPLAEEAGLITALTEVVLAISLRQAQAWQKQGLTLSVAVNVSMDSLVTLDFPDRIARALEETGIPPSQLILEVTETRLMRDRLAALDILARLRLKRIGLSIDDFGTGHSSFAQLRDVPFTELKIDRGFVHHAATETARRTIFEASLHAAQELGLKTVAEGAEDQADWDFLRASGCAMVQGFFVSRPMPGPEMPDWAAAWAQRYSTLVAGG